MLAGRFKNLFFKEDFEKLSAIVYLEFTFNFKILGVDPKSVVCVYYKQQLCQKGDKCKFSHDLTKERRSEKRNIYEDTREPGDTMENWDEKKLEDVINEKHGEDNIKKNQTQIVILNFSCPINFQVGKVKFCLNE